MKIYLDDNSDGNKLALALRAAGFEVISPRETKTVGKRDFDHIAVATKLGAALLTSDEGYALYHESMRKRNQEHSGILLVYKNNDTSKDMKYIDIARAIKNILDLGLAIENNLYNLNEFNY